MENLDEHRSTQLPSVQESNQEEQATDLFSLKRSRYIESMATPALSRTVPSSPNPSTQGSPRTRDWSNMRTGERGSAFRGISRARGGRGGGVRGGRGPSTSTTTNLVPKGGTHPETANTTPSPSSIASLTPITTSTTSNGLSGKKANGSAERDGRTKPGPRKQLRTSPAVVISTASPPKSSESAPLTPRSAHRRRRAPSGKGPAAVAKPLPPSSSTIKPQDSSTLLSLRKDVPPHLVAAHQAEIRHDIDVLVERVRAVAMAENRPTTPGSHIDWAGDEDDSLPDLDDWGVTTTHPNASHSENQGEEISPILVDTLKTLPEPSSEVHQEEDREPEIFDVDSDRVQVSSIEHSSLLDPTKGMAVAASATEKAPDQCILASTAQEELSSFMPPNGKLPSHPSLPPKPVAAMEYSNARGRPTSKLSDLSSKPCTFVAEGDPLTTKVEGLAESVHALSEDERLTLERVSSASSNERGLAASIHAPTPGLPESHSAPSLLATRPTSVTSQTHTHSRSQTEGRAGIHQTHNGPSSAKHRRHGQSGTSSPLGKHIHAHARNHSSPAAGTRLPQASRPVITDEAISKLVRTIGGHGPTPRTQPITKDPIFPP